MKARLAAFALALCAFFAVQETGRSNPILAPTPMPLSTTLYLNGPPSIVPPAPNPNVYDYHPGDQFSATKFNDNWWAPWRYIQETMLPALNGCTYVPGAVPSSYSVQLPVTISETACAPGIGTALSFGWSSTTVLTNPIATTGTVQAAGMTSTAGIVSHGDLTVDRNSTVGAIYLGNTAAHYLYFDGSNYFLGGPGNLTVQGGAYHAASSAVTATVGTESYFATDTNGAMNFLASGNSFLFRTGGGNNLLTIDATGLGTFNGGVAATTGTFTGGVVASTLKSTMLTAGNCVQTTTGGLLSTTLSPCGTPFGVLPIANGGTGAASKNFVDLTTVQNIDGNKSFTGIVAATGFLLTNDGNALTLGTTGGLIGGNASTTFFNNHANTATNVSISDAGDVTFARGGLTTSKAIVARSGYVPPVYNASGGALASTTHVVAGSTIITLNASGFGSTTVTFTGSAIFTAGNCTASVNGSGTVSTSSSVSTAVTVGIIGGQASSSPSANYICIGG